VSHKQTARLPDIYHNSYGIKIYLYQTPHISKVHTNLLLVLRCNTNDTISLFTVTKVTAIMQLVAHKMDHDSVHAYCLCNKGIAVLAEIVTARLL